MARGCRKRYPGERAANKNERTSKAWAHPTPEMRMAFTWNQLNFASLTELRTWVAFADRQVRRPAPSAILASDTVDMVIEILAALPGGGSAQRLVDRTTEYYRHLRSHIPSTAWGTCR